MKSYEIRRCIMPSAGDSFTITLKQTHLEWGTHRYTSSRDKIYGEGYIPIPSHVAHRLNIFNSNYHAEGLGLNLYNCISSDGFFEGTLKAGGCSRAGDIHAKQFHGSGNLKALGAWFARCNAQIGDQVKVTWTSPTDLIIEHF